MAKKTIVLTQKKSAIGYTRAKVRATLQALGLGKIGNTSEVPDNQAVRGMVKKVEHLLEVGSK